MSKVGRKGIEYKHVAQVCKELEEQGEVITVRKVKDVTRGSFGTVSGYIQKWRDNVIALRDSKALPEELVNALKVGFMKMYEMERKLLEGDVARDRKILDEALKQVVELESENEKQAKEIEHLNRHFSDILRKFERDLAGEKARIIDFEKREKELLAKVDDMREKLKQSEINIAIAETKTEEYEKQLAACKKAKNV